MGSALASTFGGSQEGVSETFGSTSSFGSESLGLGGSGRGSSGDSAEGGGPTSGRAPETRRRNFTYTIDVRFGETDSLRTRPGVKLLEMLPSRNRPLLTFVGVKDGREAVFLVDPELRTEGEGRCEPSARQCQFLFLRTDARSDEHFFFDREGRKYKLQLLDINAVEVDRLDRDGRSARRGKASARTERKRAARRARHPFFTLPVFFVGARR